jgi:hypothetical protein
MNRSDVVAAMVGLTGDDPENKDDNQ